MIIYDHNEILIKDYRSICYMDDHYMRIEMNDHDIDLRGEDFEIEYFQDDELKMRGKIKVIECYEDGL